MSFIVTAPPSTLPQRTLVEREHSRTSRVDFVHCGKILCVERDALSGPGTKITGRGLLATVSGLKRQFNKFYMVEPDKSKYLAKTGDIVVGRVVSVQKTLWKLAMHHRLYAIFRLEKMNLPGGELRRKNLEDEFSMGEFLNRSDLVSLEVQQSNVKRQIELHCRNLSRGKLGQGILLKVWPSLVQSQRQHVYELFDVSIVIASNGFVWISPRIISAHYGEGPTLAIPTEIRVCMVRIAACVRLLAKCHIYVSDKTIATAYKLSLGYEVKDLARNEIVQALVSKFGQLLLEENRKEAA